MNLKLFFKLFTAAFILMIFSIPSFAENNSDIGMNYLSQIVVDKPIDNSYELSLYFKDHFDGNAFLQKRKNGSFYIYIPDTVLSSKDIKLIYKNKVNKSDVVINIDEQPFIKDDVKSKYIRLAVDTPVNSEIQLVAQVYVPEPVKKGEPVVSIYSILLGMLALTILILSISIFRAMRSINRGSNTYTTFPSDFLSRKKESYIDRKQFSSFEQPEKSDIDSTTISPISTSDFNCFNLPLRKEEPIQPIYSAINQDAVYSSIEERTVQSKITNPLKRQTIVTVEQEEEPDLPLAEEIIVNNSVEKEENYRPELISELKISSNKGFYLTKVGDNAFALFGYIGEKIFFLQKFIDLKQVNLQARFYDNKDGVDIFILRLDSYKAMLGVSDTEIKELAAI